MKNCTLCLVLRIFALINEVALNIIIYFFIFSQVLFLTAGIVILTLVINATTVTILLKLLGKVTHIQQS